METHSVGIGYIKDMSPVIAEVRAVELEETNSTLPSANRIVNSWISPWTPTIQVHTTHKKCNGQGDQY